MPHPLGSFICLHHHPGWFMRPQFTVRFPVGSTDMTAVMNAEMVVVGGIERIAAALVATATGVVDGHWVHMALNKCA
jgi:hypothetical protein